MKTREPTCEVMVAREQQEQKKRFHSHPTDGQASASPRKDRRHGRPIPSLVHVSARNAQACIPSRAEGSIFFFSRERREGR